MSAGSSLPRRASGGLVPPDPAVPNFFGGGLSVFHNRVFTMGRDLGGTSAGRYRRRLRARSTVHTGEFAR